jgi:FtsH-binding integral membrane protein
MAARKIPIDLTTAAAIATGIGAAAIIATTYFGLTHIQSSLGYMLSYFLLAIATLFGFRFRWAKVPSLIVLWLTVIVFSILIVPDRDDAVRFGYEGLNLWSCALAVYLALCAGLMRKAGR